MTRMIMIKITIIIIEKEVSSATKTAWVIFDNVLQRLSSSHFTKTQLEVFFGVLFATLNAFRFY